MSTIDMFCAPDDQHRVVLLVDVLQQAGQPIALRPGPVAEPTNPSIVAFTHRAVREPWLTSLFETAGNLVAVRLDDTPLPGPCARAINMQNWPARSADRKVAALVDWLLRHGPPVEVAGLPDDQPANARRERSNAGSPRRRSVSERSAETWRNLMVLALLALGGVLLWWAAPEPGARHAASARAAQEPDTAYEAAGSTLMAVQADIEGTHGPDGMRRADSESSAANGPSADPDDAGTVAAADGAAPATDGVSVQHPGAGVPPAGAGVPPAAAPDISRPAERSRAATPEPATSASMPAAGGAGDALGHLCAARSIQAARAWAGVLNWKQRRRLAGEVCIQRLLARPGYSGLADLLYLP